MSVHVICFVCGEKRNINNFVLTLDLYGAMVNMHIFYVGALTKHYENKPIQIYRKFHPQKTENFQIKNSDIFIFLLKT